MKIRYLFLFIQIFVLSFSAIVYSLDNSKTSLSIQIKLWPTPNAPTERVLPSRGDSVTRITDISEPSLTLYQENKKGDPTPAVLIFPGGAYAYLAIDKEGREIARWFNSIGVTAIIVKYRVPDDREAAFQDGQRAMRLVRFHAKEWNIDPEHVGVIGFSAGGHLSARLSTDFKNRSYTSLDEVDKEDCRPDFCFLIYPAYLMNNQTKKLAIELPVTPYTPPTFIVQTEDDTMFVAGTIVYDQALKKSGVSSTFQLFPDGGHGYGLRPSKHAVSEWPELCEKWLRENSIINNISNKPETGEGK
jgi:acetyl esterase/lipase